MTIPTGEWRGKFFKHREFACNCNQCGPADVDDALVALLDLIRDAVGQPIKITSGTRCIDYNKASSGAKRSFHLPRDGISYAADFQLGSMSKNTKERILHLYLLADKFSLSESLNTGLIAYPTWIHLDTRGMLDWAPYRSFKRFPWSNF
jgi:uncharacterized protein YcbK (DUF882 family)